MAFAPAKVQAKSFLGTSCSVKPVRASAKFAAPRSRQSLVVRADGYIGSTTNLIMVASVSAFLVAGRFGLAPTANRNTTAGLKFVENRSAGQLTGDPAGFTAVDVLALGAFGHMFGVGLVLGLKGIGAI